MMKKVITFAAAITLLPVCFSASFDCKDAAHAVEKMICSSSELNRLDEDVGNAYKDALKVPSSVFEIKGSQREWIKETRKCGDESCLIGLYQDRLKTLNDLIVNQKKSTDENTPSIPSANQTEKVVPKSTSDANPPTNSAANTKKSESSGSNFGIYLIVLIVLGSLGYFLKKIFGGTRKSASDSIRDKISSSSSTSNSPPTEYKQQSGTSVEPDSGVVDYDPSIFSADDEATDSEIDIEKSQIEGLMSIKKSRENQVNFDRLLNQIGYPGTNILGQYFTEDPRYESVGDAGLASAWDSCMASSRDEKTQLIFENLQNFRNDPDIYTLWKYILLNQYVAVDLNVSSVVEFSSPFSLLEFIGGDIDDCLSKMREVGNLFLSKQISESNYQDAMKSLVLCYLAASFSCEDSYSYVRNLIHLIATNEPIDDVCFEDGSWGRGEHMQGCRRVVEELSNVRLEAPDGVDPEQDSYFDYVDWDEVADRVHSHLA